MKYQQVSVDFVNMVFTAFSYLALAGAAWIFLRLLQACFWLPRHLRKQNDVQQMLQEKVESYEKYLLDCEKEEKNGELGETTTTLQPPVQIPSDDKTPNRTNEEKWKERRECLKMLKRELKRVKDGGDIYDWDYLLEEDDKPEEDAMKNETNETGHTIGNNEILKNSVDCEILEYTDKPEESNEGKKDK